MTEQPPGFVLPLRLIMAFRAIVDEVHAELADQGHPDVRPLFGFVFQAIGPHGTTAADLARALGVSKQAAGKTIATLADLGYVAVSPDPGDARRKLVNLTPHGVDCLVRTNRAFDAIRDRWVDRLGAERVRALDADLGRMAPGDVFRLDMPGWFGGAG
ncbi:MarR family winged helix-turn-helix transcriptional regulator [Yinghuangia sp. ASG 101]|uniref:MarR family winged helix-turn-helix transcriptional regulator n=1 Tax=Yinghuangia sp. ASG 101 TaxID=2896848 RepID=UPI001E3C34B2|nr:MarR family winged helix-turn-helix transcriptional regulator [Yinghuangia sp. ASG 101]UGQ13101.1 MarR family winged helix-turn-helix transcriptional regulator [Yinghuangia sp. ASG 101]